MIFYIKYNNAVCILKKNLGKIADIEVAVT